MLEGNNVEGVLVLNTPWPSIARTIYRDHNRYLETYMKVSSYQLPILRDNFISLSPTPAHSTLETALLVMSTAISGSRAVSTVCFLYVYSSSFCLLRPLIADVINVSGHRLSTAEIESALIMHKGVAETAGRLPSSI